MVRIAVFGELFAGSEYPCIIPSITRSVSTSPPLHAETKQFAANNTVRRIQYIFQQSFSNSFSN